MIISHKYRFIFIKTRKTAGTSIEVDLNKFLGVDDIATAIHPAVEGHHPQNHIVKNGFFLKKTVLRNHMSADVVRSFIGNEVWSQYFKFCVEREPVSKTISQYSMLINSPDHNRIDKDTSFDEYVRRGVFPLDADKYTDSRGQLIVDRILRFENLRDELLAVSKLLGFRLDVKTKAKSGFGLDLTPTELQKEIIYDAFKSSNRFTGYRLEDVI